MVSEAADDCEAALEALAQAKQAALATGLVPATDMVEKLASWGSWLSGGERAEVVELEELAGQQLAATWVVAEAELMSGGVELRRGSYMRGSLALRRAWKWYEQLLRELEAREEDAGAEDGDGGEDSRTIPPLVKAGILFGAALFHFLTSLTPQSFHWIVEALGFKPDRAAGVAELHACHELRSYRSPYASLLLLWCYGFFVEDGESAAQLLEDVTAAYPRCAFFNYLGGYIHRKARRLDEAEALFVAVRDHSEQLATFTTLGGFEVGWCAYIRRDWDTAAAAFQSFLERHQSPSNKAWCAFLLTVTLHRLGREEEAAAVAGRVAELVRPHFTWDAFAARKSAQYVDRGFSAAELTAFRGHCEFKCGDYDDAIETLRGVADAPPPPPGSPYSAYAADVAAYATYFLGRTLQLRGGGEDDLAAAADAFCTVLAADSAVVEERYLIPHAAFSLAEVRLAQGELDAVQPLLKQAVTGSFDFDKPLRRKAQRVRDRLAKLRGKP
eukprot:PLAT4969.1.p1 GENE.PLAT4969.1~~PLAT4969.1.p1  ORF type:complete len:500 (+),score=196.88 PLAT4969.1:178-1677(+)